MLLFARPQGVAGNLGQEGGNLVGKKATVVLLNMFSEQFVPLTARAMAW